MSRERATKGYFDADAFYAALDAQRISRKMNWKQVAADAGVSASTLTRMSQGKRPDVDSLAALAAWSGLDTDEFVRTTTGTRPADAEPLARITAYLRSDPNLSDDAASALDELVRAAYSRMRKTDA